MRIEAGLVEEPLESAKEKSRSNKKNRRGRKKSMQTVVQKLFETCKEVFSPGGAGFVPPPEDVERLRLVLGMFWGRILPSGICLYFLVWVWISLLMVWMASGFCSNALAWIRKRDFCGWCLWNLWIEVGFLMIFGLGHIFLYFFGLFENVKCLLSNYYQPQHFHEMFVTRKNRGDKNTPWRAVPNL